MHITFITEDQSSNSLGRTYCLWLLAERLGWESVILTTRGDSVWRPLQGTPLAEAVVRVSEDELARRVPKETDLIVACKPLPASFGLGLTAAKSLAKPLLLDIDDPDLEIRMRTGNPVLALLRWARRPRRSWRDLRFKRLARRLPTIVSNPWLGRRYGGTVIPHARPELGMGQAHESHAPRIVFVGSVHPHKGIDLLRDAVAAVQEHGVTLTITAEPPSQVRPGESWIGQTSIEQGVQIARDADIIALPSLRRRNAIGQLPAKLIDAMMLGRAIIVSDVAPMPWALGGSGIVTPAGRVRPLIEAIERLVQPVERARLGESARRRALEHYTVDALAPRFESACLAALNQGPLA